MSIEVGDLYRHVLRNRAVRVVEVVGDFKSGIKSIESKTTHEPFETYVTPIQRFEREYACIMESSNAA